MLKTHLYHRQNAITVRMKRNLDDGGKLYIFVAIPTYMHTYIYCVIIFTELASNQISSLGLLLTVVAIECKGSI